MELPQGVNFNNISRSTHCLKVVKNIYGGKESGRTWFNFLKQQFTTKLGCTQSMYDECVFYKANTVFLVYTDDGILLDPSESVLNKRMTEIATLFDIEDQGTIQDYLGIKIRHTDEGQIHFTQPHLIESILIDLERLDKEGKTKENTTIRQLPSLVTKLIGPDDDGPPFSYNWNYRSVLGKLNFLEKINPSRHHLCCSSISKVLHLSKAQSWPGNETSWLLPTWNQRQRNHNVTIQSTKTNLLC